MKDAIIFGGGLAGCLLAEELLEAGKNIVLVDDPRKSRCSQVAAGLINPIAGSRLNLAWMADSIIPYSIRHYNKLSEKLGSQFFYPRKLIRLFSNEEERGIFNTKTGDPSYAKWTEPVEDTHVVANINERADNGFSVKHAGYVDTPSLLSHLKAHIAERAEMKEKPFQYEEISIHDDYIEWSGIKAKHAIFCEGHLATRNPWFSHYPFKPAQGVIGRISTNIDFSDTIIIKRYFLIPRHDGVIYVGATYSWDNFDDSPDEEGIAELEDFLHSHLGSDWHWDTLDAGIRPATAGGMPIVGRHPDHECLIAFNGFGSKGCMQIPFLANQITKHLWGDVNLPKEADLARFEKKRPTTRWKATDFARDRVLEIVKEGDVVCDATCGNGHDTLWLAEAVGAAGHVHAFDIQSQAIEITADRLREANLLGRVSFSLNGHEHLVKSIPTSDHGEIKAVVFNLGYLPRSDKSVSTRSETTLEALNASLFVLKPGGILSVVLYYGHRGGAEEAECVERWRKNLDPKVYSTDHIRNPNPSLNSPSVILVRKLDEAAQPN